MTNAKGQKVPRIYLNICMQFQTLRCVHYRFYLFLVRPIQESIAEFEFDPSICVPSFHPGNFNLTKSSSCANFLSASANVQLPSVCSSKSLLCLAHVHKRKRRRKKNGNECINTLLANIYTCIHTSSIHITRYSLTHKENNNNLKILKSYCFAARFSSFFSSTSALFSSRLFLVDKSTSPRMYSDHWFRRPNYHRQDKYGLCAYSCLWRLPQRTQEHPRKKETIRAPSLVCVFVNDRRLYQDVSN